MTEKHILVVEDDPDGQEFVATVLRHVQFVVTAVDDAESALDLMFHQNMRFDAIIIDLALPGKDGWQLLEEILQQTQTASMPCIAITAYHNSKLREDALKAGFTAYFSKPLDGTHFARSLDSILA